MEMIDAVVCDDCGSECETWSTWEVLLCPTCYEALQRDSDRVKPRSPEDVADDLWRDILILHRLMRGLEGI